MSDHQDESEALDLDQVAPPSMEARRALALAEAMAVLDRYSPPMLFLFAFALRLAAATNVHFPGLDDPAYYYQVATNLAAGRGLTVDTIWGWLVDFPTVTHASNEHWMPLASMVLAPFFALFGPNFQLAQLVGAAAGAALAPIAWHLSREALRDHAPWRAFGWFAGMFIAINPSLVYQAIAVDSSVYFTLFGALAVLLAVTWLVESNVGAAVTGLVVGLAYLSRTEGLLLALVFLPVVWLQTEREAKLRRTLIFVGGVAALVLPWWFRNLMAFGSPSPVPLGLVALVPDYAALFHFGGPAREGFAQAGVFDLMGERLQALGQNASLVLQITVPLVITAIVAVVRLWDTLALRVTLAVTVVLVAVPALLVPVLDQWGVFFHDVGALAPGLVVFGGFGWFWFWRSVGRSVAPGSAAFMGVAMCIGVLGLEIANTMLDWGEVGERYTRWGQQFAVARDWLADKPAGVVMTNQPNSLNFATGRPAVMLPVADGPDILRQVAQRYDVVYLVGFWDLPPLGASNRYPAALQAAPGVTELFAQDGVVIYQLR